MVLWERMFLVFQVCWLWAKMFSVKYARCFKRKSKFDKNWCAIDIYFQKWLSNPKCLKLKPRFKEFSERGQSLIIQLCENSEGLSEAQKLKIMNLLDPRLKSLSSYLVLQICRIFLSITWDNKAMLAQVLKRLGQCLITMLISTEDEVHFSVLVHVERVIDVGGPGVFEDQFKRFYIYGDEKRYVQDTRLRILTKVASKANFSQIFGELCQYSNEINSGLAKAALQALGRLSRKFPHKLDLIFKHLSTCVSLDSEGQGREYLFDALVASLRKAVEPLSTQEDSFSITEFPELGPLLNKFGRISEGLVSAKAKSDYIWLVAKFAKYIKHASYYIEGYVNSFEEESIRLAQQQLGEGEAVQHVSKRQREVLLGDGEAKEFRKEESDEGLTLPVSLKLQVMNAAFYCFFVKRREMFPIIGKLFAVTLEGEHQDPLFQTKARNCYALMKSDLCGFEKFIRNYYESAYTVKKSDAADMAQKREKIAGLNKLSIFYEKADNVFIKPKAHFDKLRQKQEIEVVLDINSKNNVDMDIDDFEHNIPDEAPVESPSQKEGQMLDLTEFDLPQVEEEARQGGEATAGQDIDFGLDMMDAKASPSNPTARTNDMLDFGDFGADPKAEISNIPETTPKQEKVKEVECLARELDAEDFQDWWVDFESEIEGNVKPVSSQAIARDLAELMEEENVFCMASKDSGDGNQQYYMYAYLGYASEDPEFVK